MSFLEIMNIEISFLFVNNIYKQIFLSLCKYGSYRKLSLAMNIPHTTLRGMVENFKNEIKNKL